MKKWMLASVFAMLIIIMAACGNSEEPKAETESPATAEEQQGVTDTEAVKDEEEVSAEKTEELSAKEVYEQALKASENMKSMHAVMDIDQVIEVPGEEVKMDSKIRTDMKMIVKPLAMHQKMKMDMGEQGSMDTEIYMTEAGFFMYEPESGEWIKFPAEMSEDMIAQMGGDSDPTPDMEMFENYTDDFDMKETDKEYVLTLKADGEKFNKLIQESIADNMPAGLEMSSEEAEVMENIDVKDMMFVLYIDKETFQTNAFDMQMDMTMAVEGQEVHIKQNMKSIIDKINEIDAIEVPKEVTDNAMDIEDLTSQQQ